MTITVAVYCTYFESIIVQSTRKNVVCLKRLKTSAFRSSELNGGVYRLYDMHAELHNHTYVPARLRQAKEEALYCAKCNNCVCVM